MMATAYGAELPGLISAWPVICPPRNAYVAMHCASWRCTEVTVQTPPWCPTSVLPLSSWVVATKGGSLELLLGSDGVHAEGPLLVLVTG